MTKAGGQSITFPWPSQILRPNIGAHYMRKHAAKKAAKKEAFTLAKEAGLSAPEGVIAVKIDAYPKWERKRDYDNLVATLKAHLDGLALAIDADDSRFRPHLTIHPADGRGVITLTVEAA